MAQVPQARIGWRWTLIALGLLSWFSIGCSPSSLSMLLMPWNDNKIEPEHKLFVKEDKLFAKEEAITLVILANFVQPAADLDHIAAQAEIPDHLTQFFRKRCLENKHKIKIVSQAEVRPQYDRLRAEGGASPLELGKHFKADYVLDLKIQRFGLYDNIIGGKYFRGRAEIAVELHKVNATDDIPFHKDLNFEYPGTRGAIDASTTNPPAFRRLFLTKIARDVTKLFIAFPPEEKKPFD